MGSPIVHVSHVGVPTTLHASHSLTGNELIRPDHPRSADLNRKEE